MAQTQFKIIDPIRSLNHKEKGVLKLVDDVRTGKSKIEEIADIPAGASYNNKPGKLEFTQRNHQDFLENHGEYGVENFIITANNPTYIIKNVNKNPDKINLIKVIPGTHNYFIIGANRMSSDNYFIATHFEVVKNNKKSLDTLLSRGELVK